jgi:GAF domain-containing protein
MSLKRELLAGIESAADFASAADFVCRTLRAREPRYNWVGIYMVEGDDLVLRAWDGPQATEHVRIPIGEGICGLAARTRETVIVDDVNKDPRYLACFVTTKSEIVVPIMRGGECIGEIDVDGDAPGAFDSLDKLLLEDVAAGLAAAYG